MLKKFFYFIVSALLSISLIACSGTDSSDSSSNTDNNANESEQDSENTDNETSENTDAEDADDGDAVPTESKNTDNNNFNVGDTAEVANIKFTLKKASLTDERNPMIKENPKMVVKLEYEIKNDTDEEIPTGGDIEVFDGSGKQWYPYPLELTTGSIQPGEKINGVAHFGIEEGPIEVHFKPIISIDEKAIFKVPIK